jgi:quercetin dioxygenase-like cupin family protein
MELRLEALERDLRSDEGYLRGDHTARTLVHEPDLRVVLIAMKAGGRLEEHRAKATASVHVLSGRIRVDLPAKAVTLSAGSLLVLEGGLRHAVEAETESAFLLTLGGPGEG